jgi:tetratricopeptide (TPR) repeat protein
MESGHRKEARRLFRHALAAPTENALAQVGWAVRRDPQLLEIDERAFETPRPFEARAWERFSLQAWAESVTAAAEWLLDEPFATRPAVFGSFLSDAALGDYERSAAFARQGLGANPDDVWLLNNLAVALATLGRVQEAALSHARIRRANLDAEEQTVYLATKGLLAYRGGRWEEGRALYEQAIEGATSRGDKKTRVWAELYHLREQMRVRTINPGAALLRAEEAIRDLPAAQRAVATQMLRRLARFDFGPERFLRAAAFALTGRRLPFVRRVLRALGKLAKRAWPFSPRRD